MTVTLVIPTWRRAPWLARCLDGVARQGNLPDEILVAGRASDPDAQVVVASFAERLPVRWVEVDEPGHIPPVQKGLAQASGEIVAFLDDDTEPLEGWLARLVEPFSSPDVGCVGGAVRIADFRGRVHRDAGRIRWYGKIVGNVGERRGSRPVVLDTVMECNWAWRRILLEQLEFAPVFRQGDSSMYGLDLCLQAKERGYAVIFEPRSVVLHHVAPRDEEISRDDYPRRVRDYCRNYTFVALRRFQGVRRIAFAMWWWLVGERGSYAPVTALIDVTSGRRGVWTLLRESMAGRMEGLRWAGGGTVRSRAGAEAQG